MDWKSQAFAQSFRDVISELVIRELSKSRPSDLLATVQSIDNANNKCDVIFAGDTDPVEVSLYTIRPSTGGGLAVGDVVRVGGNRRKYVTEVVKGAPFIKVGSIAATALQTTASAANLFIDVASGVIYRSTSSLRYKKDIQSFDVSDQVIKKLRPVTYKPKFSEDTKSYVGLIAEEVAYLEDDILEQLIVRDADGSPDALQYERLAVILLPVVQRLIQRIEKLERQ